jgi:hypothetical protein
VESVVALIRGLFGFDGPLDTLAFATRAAELETNGNLAWFAAANTALGHASYMIGDLDTAYFRRRRQARPRPPCYGFSLSRPWRWLKRS